MDASASVTGIHNPFTQGIYAFLFIFLFHFLTIAEPENLLSAAPTLPPRLIVIPRNEAAMIGECLESVPFAAEKIVVDCGSTDGTQERAAHVAQSRPPALAVMHRLDPTLVQKQLMLPRYAELKVRDWLDRSKPVRLWMCPCVFVAAFRNPG